MPPHMNSATSSTRCVMLGALENQPVVGTQGGAGAVVLTPFGEVVVQGTPLDSGTRGTMIQAIAEQIPEDQKDEVQDLWRWHMGSLLGSGTAPGEEKRKVTPNNLSSLQQ